MSDNSGSILVPLEVDVPRDGALAMLARALERCIWWQCPMLRRWGYEQINQEHWVRLLADAGVVPLHEWGQGDE